MNYEYFHLRIAGVCAIATALCEVAGTAIGEVYGLGGQNLPVATHEELGLLAESSLPFLLREWFYLFVAIFAIGEGLGLYFLMRNSSLALWAVIAWIVGLMVGIVEDAAVIGLINHVVSVYPVATETSRESMLFATGLSFETIKIQQFISLLLSVGVGGLLFSVVGWRSRALPRWLCIVGILAAVTTGWCFGLCNVVLDSEDAALLFENGFALVVIWDLTVGIVLLSSATNAT